MEESKEKEAVSDDTADEQDEQFDPTTETPTFASQADEMLAQVKAYSMSLARETQVS